MFCRNCGKELTGAPEICLNCGAKPTAGTSFCPGCGAPTTPLTEICAKCGVRLTEAIRGKTWKTRTAGILAIVAGAVGLAQWVTIAAVEIPYWGWLPMGGGLGGIVATAVVAVEIAIGIVAIVGGVFALKRKRWRLALAGSICAIFSFFLFFLNVPLGIAATVLVVLGKGEFEQSPRLGKSCESDLKEV
jgi:Double zinc ribbon